MPKKTGGLFSALLIAGAANGAYNCITASESNCNEGAILSFGYELDRCTSSTNTCYKTGTFTYGSTSSCNTCKYPYTRVQATVPTTVCSNNITYYRCVCQCSDCTDTAWTNVSGSSTHQSMIRASCSCSTGTAKCTKTTVYRCRAGYYGNPTSSTSGCTECPPDNNVAGTSDLDYNYSRSDCYIPKNTTVTDTTGSYQYNADCYSD